MMNMMTTMIAAMITTMTSNLSTIKMSALLFVKHL
jgi:hypothetical protein